MIDRRAFLNLVAAIVAGRTGSGDEARTGTSARAVGGAIDKGPVGSGGTSPWGIATSHSRSLNLGWLAPIERAGITALRGFDGGNADASLNAAQDAGFEISGFLQMGSSFPADDLDAWGDHVASRVEAAAGRVKRWEVWNEPPNFSSDKNPENYAALVVRAHDVVKRMDPTAQVGICAASVHLHFMERALLAGAAGHFDYVTLHPYETLSTLERGFEPLFLSIGSTVRKMLRASSPAQEWAPIVFTEIGRPVSNGITPEMQANALLKTFVLSLAQGVARVYWFEGIDGDSGPFGLIAGDGTPRPSYHAAQNLIAHLGRHPTFLGWLEVLGAPRAFVFDGAAGPVLVAWPPPGAKARIDLGDDASVIDPRTGETTSARAWRLDEAPVIATGLAPGLVDEARANLGRALPWYGDFTDADRVTFRAPDRARGVHPLKAAPLITIEGVVARDHGAATAHRFSIDPNFLSYDTVPLRITVEVRRTREDAAGFNLKYESIDGIHAAGSWRSVPAEDRWHTVQWNVDDARFVGKWGYHLFLDSDSRAYSGYSLRRMTVEKR